jgi:G3E family GTPase
MADRLLLTKCDLSTPDMLNDVSRSLKRINPGAPQIFIRQGEVAVASIVDCGLYDPGSKSPDVDSWLAEEQVREQQRQVAHHDHVHDMNRHDAHVHSFALTFNEPLDWLAFTDAIAILIDTLGERILRIKGLLNVQGDHKPRVIQCVQRVMYPYSRLDAWPTTPPYCDQKSRVVFIVRDVPQSMVEQAFAMFCHVLPEGA